MFVQLLEALVFVVLTGDVRAHASKLLQLLLNLLGRSLDVGLYPLEVLLVVHLRARISDDLDIFWEKVVAVLKIWSGEAREDHIGGVLTSPKRAGNCRIPSVTAR